MDSLINQINKIPFEVRGLEQFSVKVDLIDLFFDKLKLLTTQNIDRLDPKIVEDIKNNVIGLSYSLDYVIGEMARMDKDRFNLLRGKLNKIGYAFLSFSKLFMPINGKEYLHVLHTSKALVNYDAAVISCLDMEIKIISYRLNNDDRPA